MGRESKEGQWREIQWGEEEEGEGGNWRKKDEILHAFSHAESRLKIHVSVHTCDKTAKEGKKKQKRTMGAQIRQGTMIYMHKTVVLRARKTAQWVKCLLCQPDNLSSVTQNLLRGERRKLTHKVVLWPHTAMGCAQPPYMSHIICQEPFPP